MPVLAMPAGERAAELPPALPRAKPQLSVERGCAQLRLFVLHVDASHKRTLQGSSSLTKT